MAAVMSSVSLVTTIQSEIEKAQTNLKDVDDNLRKLTGRDFGDVNQRPEQRRRLLSGSRDDEPPAKRRPQGVFARLGGVVLEQHYNESRGRGRGFRRSIDGSETRGDRDRSERINDGRGDLRAEIHGSGTRRGQEMAEEEDQAPKPSLASSVARPQADFKSRTEAAAELTKDRASRDRNRRMFGALLGTLKRFKNDEAKQKDKEEQRAAIDRKLEEKGRVEKEELRRERLDLFNQRKEQQAQIRRLSIKMERVKEHEVWEAHMMKLTKFIRTKSSPRIFWLPRTHNSRTTSLVRATHDVIVRELEQDRQRLKEDLEEILGNPCEEGRDDPEGGDDDEDEEFVSRGVRSEIVRQGEGGTSDPFDNTADLLDYEAEEGELVYEAEDLSGKDTNDTERVVVQVDGRGNGGRKVEIVGGGNLGQSMDRGPEIIMSKVGLVGGGNDSEKENHTLHKERSKDKDRNTDKERDKERRHKDKGKDKDRGKEKDKGRDLDKDRGKDRRSGRDKDRDKKKEKSRDKGKEKEKEKSMSKENLEDLEEPMSPDLEATIVDIKIEKDEEDFGVKDNEPLKNIKEEKQDKTGPSKAEEKNENITLNDNTNDGELPPSPTIVDFPLPTDSPSPPREDAAMALPTSPTLPPAVAVSLSESSPLLPISKPSSPPHSSLPSSPPIPLSSPKLPASPPPPPKPLSPKITPDVIPVSATTLLLKDQTSVENAATQNDVFLDNEELKKINTDSIINMDINPEDIQLPEGPPVKQHTSTDKKSSSSTSSKHKGSKDDNKKVSDNKTEKAKKKDESKKDDLKKLDHKRSDDSKKIDKKSDEKKGDAKRDSGSSDDSSSDDSSSESSTDSSESDSSDSESSSSSSDSSSGSSSDSESDSSSSSSSESDSDGGKKKKIKKSNKRRNKKRRDSRSDYSSSDSETDKSRSKKKYDQSKQKDASKKKDEKTNPKEHRLDSERGKRSGKDRYKGKETDKNSKEKDSKSRDKERGRDTSRRQEREKTRGTDSSKSREPKRNRSRSKDRNSRRERSKSRDKNRKDRKERR